MSRSYYSENPEQFGYDYTNQAWVVDGVYQDCGHPNVDCGCFAREHKGQPVFVGATVA